MEVTALLISTRFKFSRSNATILDRQLGRPIHSTDFHSYRQAIKNIGRLRAILAV